MLAVLIMQPLPITDDGLIIDPAKITLPFPSCDSKPI